MKPANLMLSAAIASLMLFAPAAFTSSDAAGIKIKPQTIKVKPKIKVAKPKARIKVRTTKIRIKPRIKKVKPKIAIAKPKVRIKTRTMKIQIRPKVKATVRAAKVQMKPKLQLPAVQLRKKPRITPKVAVSRKTKAAVAKAAMTGSFARANSPLLENSRKVGRYGRHRGPARGNRRQSTLYPDKGSSIITHTPGTGIDTTYSHPTKPRNTPDLNVSAGFVDVFKVSGGNLNEALRHANDLNALMGERAIPDLINSGFGDGQGGLPGGDGLGRQRFAPGMEQAPIGSADVPNDGGKASSGTDTSRYVTPTRYGDSILVESGHTNSDGNRVHSTTEIIPGPTGTTRINTVTTYYDYEDGTSVTDVKVTTTTSTERTRSEHTEVEPAEVRRKPGEGTDTPSEKPEKPNKQVDGGTKAGGGDQGGNYIPPSTYSRTWNPMNGEVISTVTSFDRISQPDNRDGTTSERSARPNVGPAAVTNTGDGSFAAGRGGSDRSGGVSIGHCVRVSGGCGGVDPDGPGPEGTVADAGTASSH